MHHMCAPELDDESPSLAWRVGSELVRLRKSIPPIPPRVSYYSRRHFASKIGAGSSLGDERLGGQSHVLLQRRDCVLGIARVDRVHDLQVAGYIHVAHRSLDS